MSTKRRDFPQSLRTAALRPASGAGRAVAAALLVAVAIGSACGPRVSKVETAQVRERDRDAEVLVYVRDRDGIPTCPWEVLGAVEVDDGWAEDEGELRGVRRAAAELGGHAVLAETAADREVRVVRFFDPLCNPLRSKN